MNLTKIGKYIAKKRQENNFTQESLAEELDVSDRSISKWERGICLPDADNMAKLCKLFKISYNELLSGEDLQKADYEKKAEDNLEEFAKIETAQNKKFFLYENVIGFISCAVLLLAVLIFSSAEMSSLWIRITSLVFGFIVFIIGMSFGIKIETEAGKYECKNCGHRYVPKYSSVYLAPHLGRTRHMTCPKCHKKSWQRKLA